MTDFAAEHSKLITDSRLFLPAFFPDRNGAGMIGGKNMTIKEKLKAGRKVYGTMIRVVRNPAICWLAKNAGLDFIMFDCEHAPFTLETLHDCFAAAHALNLDGYLRASELSKSWISRALDAGAGGVMVPMTETPDQAKEIVKWSKYAPIGERGYGSNSMATNYIKGSSSAEVMKGLNDKTVSIAQIETKLAVDNADAIAAVEGIDVLLIGPNDLSISLGVPGDLMNPIEIEAISHVAAMCKKNGKGFGIHAGPKMLQRFAEELTFVMCSCDTDVLTAGFEGIKKTCEEL